MVLSFIISFFSFLSITYIITKFPISVYGKFSIFQNTIFLVSMFGSGWLNQSILRLNNKTTFFENKIYIIFRALSHIVFIIGFIIIFIITKNWLYSITGASIIIIQSLSSIKTSFYMSNLNVYKAFIVDLFKIVIFFSFLLISFSLIKKRIDFNNLIIVYFISSITFLFYLIRGVNVKKINYSLKIKHLLYISKSEHFKYGSPFIFWFLASHLLNISDRYIISYYCSQEDLGLYSAAYDMSNKIISFIFLPFSYIFMPFITDYFNNNQYNKIKKVINKILLIQSIILCLILLISYLFGSFIQPKVINFGIALKSYDIFLLIISSSIIYQMALIAHKPFELLKKTNLMLRYILIALLVNVTLNIIFVKYYGILFAAFSSLLCSCIYLIFVSYYSSEKK